MKRTFLLFFGILILSKVNSQKGKDIFQINGLTDYQFFDSANKLFRGNLCGLEKNYYLYIGFNLSKEGAISDITTAEIPGLDCPEFLKEYIIKLIQYSSGKWELLSIKSSDYPKEIIYQVELVIKDYWKVEIKQGSEFSKALFKEISKEIKDAVPLIRKYDNGGRLLILPIDFN